MSLIFHRIWTSRSLLTYIMRWRVLFTKIPGPVRYGINSCHKTYLKALCEAGGHELGVKSMRERTGWERGRVNGCGGIRGKKRKSDKHSERNTHIQKHTQRDCVWETLLWSLSAEGCVFRNFRMCLCVMCYLNSYTTLSRKPNITI